jgi:hypothetical protein
MEIFKTLHQHDKDGKLYFKKVKAERITLSETPCFIFQEEIERDDGRVTIFNVSMISSGMMIFTHISRPEVIKGAAANLIDFKSEIEATLELIQQKGIKVPVNT